jgi:phosphotransferase system enzyme I (PtsI)
VRICGEMSSNPFHAVLFLGMGFNQLSMNPRFIPAIRRVVSAVSTRAARQIAEKAVTLTTTREIAEFLIREVSILVKADLSAYVKEISISQDPTNY